MWEKFLLCSIFYFVVWTQSEKMSKSGSEETLEKLKALIEKAQKQKVDLKSLKPIEKLGKLLKEDNKLLISCLFFLLLAVYGTSGQLFLTEKCWISNPKDFGKIFRKPDYCSFCQGIGSGLRISNINPDEFEEKYAYNGNVVIVTDATKNWTASEVFNFWYFKDLYEKEDPKMKTRECQFFRYKTSFQNIFEALKMNADRVNYKSGSDPWYFGWSNCNEHIASKLRKHYDRPYFLPKTSEINAVDWIFMGGHGLGAHMHLDNVFLPSWQAQLKGTKEWLLAPPPECIFKCSFFSVTVNPGDVIVLDTNRWYHKTNVLSDEISITIGAEYD